MYRDLFSQMVIVVNWINQFDPNRVVDYAFMKQPIKITVNEPELNQAIIKTPMIIRPDQNIKIKNLFDIQKV